MSFGAAIEALIGADVSDVQAKGQLVETIALKMDAALQKVGLGNLADKSARESAAAMQQIMAAEDRLAAFRRSASLEQMSNGERLFVLNRELVAQKQQLGTIEKGTLAYMEAQLAIEEKQLEVQRLFNAERKRMDDEAAEAARNSARGGAGAPANDDFSKVLQRKFGIGDALKGLLQGVGMAGVQQIGEALVAPFKEAAASAEKIAQYTEASMNATKQLIALRLTDAQQLAQIEKQMASLQRQSAEMAKPKDGAWWERMLSTTMPGLYFYFYGNAKAAERAAEAAKNASEQSAAQLEIEQRKLAIEQRRAAIAEETRKLAYEDLTAKQRVVAITDDIDYLQSQLVIHARDELAVQKIQDQLRERERELREANKTLAQQTNLPEEKQVEMARLSLEYRKTGSIVAKTQIDILQLQTQQLEKHSELLPLIQKGYQNLTPVERARFDELVKQGDKLEKQIQQKAQIITATKQQADAEKLVGGVIDSNIAKWEEFVGVIKSTGRSDRDLTDRELAKKIQNIQDDIFQRQLGSSAKYGPLGADFFIAPQKFNLQQALAEQNFRNSVRSAASQFGADRAFNMFPGLTEQRFQDILNGTTEQQRNSRDTLTEVRKLNENFTNGLTKLSESIKSTGGRG